MLLALRNKRYHKLYRLRLLKGNKLFYQQDLFLLFTYKAFNIKYKSITTALQAGVRFGNDVLSELEYFFGLISYAFINTS